MNYILLNWSYGRKSVRMVVDAMSEPCRALAKKPQGWYLYDKEEGGYVPTNGVLKIIGDSSNNIINWGNYIFGSDEPFKLNKPSAIRLTANKAKSRLWLQSRGVAVPETHNSSDLYFYNQDMLPVIVRPSHHHGGKEFFVFENIIGLRGFLWGKDMSSWYVSALFEKTHEYRVHVAHGKVLFINEKPLVEGELRANHIVNHEAWRALKWSEFHPGICQESIKAVKTLGLDYGAVDIMYNADTDRYAICEVNTSPSVTTPYSSQKYAEYFSWVIRHDFPEHFQPDGTSVFYNKILRS